MPRTRGHGRKRLRRLHRVRFEPLLFVPSGKGTHRTHARVFSASLILALRIGAVGNNPALAGLGHEAEELAAHETEFHLGGLLQGLLRVQSACVKKLERSLDFVAIRWAEPRAPQPENV